MSETRLTAANADAIARSHGHDMMSRVSDIENRRIATRTVAITRNFRSAASTEAGAPALIVDACSAARRDRTGLDAAA